jgi:PAS domain-containing protein
LTFYRIIVDGEPTGVSVFGSDISQLKAAESARRQSEKNYRAIFNDALEGIYQTTIDGQVVSVNPALARILGYSSPDEFMSAVKDAGYPDKWPLAQVLLTGRGTHRPGVELPSRHQSP